MMTNKLPDLWNTARLLPGYNAADWIMTQAHIETLEALARRVASIPWPDPVTLVVGLPIEHAVIASRMAREIVAQAGLVK